MVDLKDIVVDEEFAALCPPLTDEERTQLVENIDRDGFRDPVVVWQNHSTLIDGHNRFKIWQADYDEDEGPEVVEVKLEDRDAVKAWIAKNQLGRRNLNTFQRAELALVMEPELRKKAKERQGNRSDIQQNSAESSETRKELAEIAEVSHDTIQRVKAIKEKAAPATIEKLRSGDVSINAAYQKLNPHISQNAGDNEWYTPGFLIKAATAVLGSIDLDPASSKEANDVVGASLFYSPEDDGLAKSWTGAVWMNPPYAQPLVSQFCEKLAQEFEEGGVTSAIVLVNNATETQWFQCVAAVSSSVCFPKGRIKFWHPCKVSTPLQGQAILFLGADVNGFYKHFSSFGFIGRMVQRG